MAVVFKREDKRIRNLLKISNSIIVKKGNLFVDTHIQVSFIFYLPITVAVIVSVEVVTIIILVVVVLIQIHIIKKLIGKFNIVYIVLIVAVVALVITVVITISTVIFVQR